MHSQYDQLINENMENTFTFHNVSLIKHDNMRIRKYKTFQIINIIFIKNKKM